MKFNKRGFTLIELLAVIVIMGILMMIAIPAMTRYIENSRKDSFVNIAKKYVTAARNIWLSGDIDCGIDKILSINSSNGKYYIPIDTTNPNLPELLESGGKSPWGNADLFGYIKIVVGENNNKNQTTKYYIYLTDKQGHGIINDQKEASNITREDILVKDATIKKFPDAESISCPYKQIDPESFENDSWETIISAVKGGNTENYHVGDTKQVDMGSFGTHTLRIANKSTPAECNNEDFSQTACGFVLEFADIITKHNINSTTTNSGGWPNSELYNYVNQDIYNSLPGVLQNKIIDTRVVSGHGLNDSSNFTSIDKLYLLTELEVWGTDAFGRDTAVTKTRQLDYYRDSGISSSNYSGASKQYNGTNSFWWLRTPFSTDNYYFYYVNSTGDWYYNHATEVNGISPAFRIG